MRLLGIAEFTIHLVAYQEEVVLFAELAHSDHFLPGEELSGRVARIADHHGPGPVSEEFLEFGDIRNSEIFVDIGRNGLQSDTVEICKSLIIGVVWLDYNDLVSPVGSNLHSTGKGFASSYFHEQLGHIDVDAYLLVVLLDESLAELDESCGVCI